MIIKLNYLSKMSAYVKKCDCESNEMYFSIEDDDLLKKYNKIWYKVSNNVKKEFDSKPS